MDVFMGNKLKLILIALFCFSNSLVAEIKLTDLKKTNYYLSFDSKIERGYLTISKLTLTEKKSGRITSFEVKDFQGVPAAGGIPIKVMDLNGDGMEDFSLLLESGPRYVNYLYFIYSKKQKKYLKLGVYPLLKVAADGTLIAQTIDSDGETQETVYQVAQDKLQPLNQ